jgi:hypothetical protein
LGPDPTNATDPLHASGDLQAAFVMASPHQAVGGNDLIRITVNLIPKAYAELRRLSVNSGLSKTDVMNRALQVYALVEELVGQGEGSIVVQHPDGSSERIFVL